MGCFDALTSRRRMQAWTWHLTHLHSSQWSVRPPALPPLPSSWARLWSGILVPPCTPLENSRKNFSHVTRLVRIQKHREGMGVPMGGGGSTAAVWWLRSSCLLNTPDPPGLSLGCAFFPSTWQVWLRAPTLGPDPWALIAALPGTGRAGQARNMSTSVFFICQTGITTVPSSWGNCGAHTI